MLVKKNLGQPKSDMIKYLKFLCNSSKKKKTEESHLLHHENLQANSDELFTLHMGLVQK